MSLEEFLQSAREGELEIERMSDMLLRLDARAKRVTATLELLEAMEAECADLERYINLFGYNPRFGTPQPAIGSITYQPQGYDRSGKLYEEELTFV